MLCFAGLLSTNFRQDYAISIATIHHLASHSRRKLAVQVRLPCSEVGSINSISSAATFAGCLPSPWAHIDLCVGG